MKLNDKCVVLTGGCSGIGYEILKKLLDYNCHIVVADINIDNQIDSSLVSYFKCDVSKKENIDELFDYAAKKLGKIELFIANAGFAYYEKIKPSSYEHIKKIIDVNTVAPIYMAEKMKEKYSENGYNFVVTASAMGILAIPGYSLYSASKFALTGFSNAYRYELNKNEHYSVVYPIATSTNFFKNAGDNIPVAYPTQKASIVARKVINGIKNNKKNIYPSKLFRLMNILNRIFPFIFKIYINVNDKKFKKWIKRK